MGVRTVITSIAAVLPLAFVQAQPAPGYLSSKDAAALLSGNSLAGNGKANIPKLPYDWIAHYQSDGTIRMRLKPAWGGLLLKGKWWMEDDGKTCRQFETGNKLPGCWRIYREGKFIRLFPASGKAVEGRAAVLPGDELGLIPAK